jgi:D-sedoheptulose 7-phosphate isomerase
VERWSDYCETIATGLRKLAVTDRSGAAVSTADAVSQWVALTRTAHDGGGSLFIIGNGGSAGMASHMAADACKNGHLRAMSFSDVALLTATANDLAYEQVFALPLERLARPGDLLIAISSSGNSPNILRALESSRTIGLRAVTLTGMDGGNRARTLGDLNFYVPLSRYGWTESAHQVILHYWFDQYLCEHRQGAL